MSGDFKKQLELLHSAAFGWAVACCAGDMELAHDVLQEAYLRSIRNKDRFRQQSTLQTWLFGIIRITSLEFRRSNGRWNQLTATNATNSLDNSKGRMTFRSLDDKETHERIWQMLKELPARQRETLHLVFYQHMTLEEAAKTMNVSVGTVRQHYARGKVALRAKLNQSSTEKHKYEKSE